ncbi:MAG: mismatch-specific DNA-glycosylase [candidate division Zixibacteria bacterium]|nr:mismatch-specific DNA-glycosylase [candidate division Zixibacteria bacterium]MBU1471221.1 mismatch-specific DNA-glycosylase [candidate division Zixibacteria bacterium]
MSVLPDVIGPNLTVVFCGTAVSNESAQRKAYYAGPGNSFWKTLHDVGLTQWRLEPEEYKSITRYGLGLTDLVKTVSGTDATLSRDHFNVERFRKLILRHQPKIVAFTSKTAAQKYVRHRVDYGLLKETIGKTKLHVLPSPSGAARRYWSDKPWRELARLSKILG